MVFKRRDKQSLYRRLRGLFLPKKGWRRGMRYVGHRVKRLPDTPHKIALGGGIGIFICFSPLIGLHIAQVILLVYLLRANMLAAFITSIFANPVTYPFIAAVSMGVGRPILGMRTDDEDYQSVQEAFLKAFSDIWQLIKSWFGFAERPSGLADFVANLFIPYLVGGTILGLLAGIGTYFFLKPFIGAYQFKRKQITKARREKRRKLQESVADSGQ